LSYIETDLKHPSTRTVLLGQSLGTAVTAASALYFADPSSEHLPTDLTHVSPLSKSHAGFAGIVLVAPFRDLATLLETYRIGGFIPILRPLRAYTRIANFLLARIVDHWPTLPRLRSLLTLTAASKTPIRLTLLHARNDQDIDFRQSEALFQPLQSTMLGEEGVSAREERRSIHGEERVKRGAFAYKKVEDGRGERMCELEVVRYGGHNEIVGWTQVSLAIRRAFAAVEGRQERKVGLDVE
jgi:pimeloyl-ACP methyl ester carboxylesterase